MLFRSPSFAEFYQRVFVENLGRYRLIAHATLVLGILLLWRRPRDSAVLVCVLALSTCYLYAALLRNDVTTHSFSTLRFFLPLAIAAVAIVPYRVMQLAVDRSPGRRGVVKSVMMAGVALFSGLYVFDLRDWPGIGEGWRGWYLIQLRQERPPETLELAIWLRANARYEEVYFSRQWAIQENPPMAVAISRKLVWHVESSLAHYVGTLPRGTVPRFVGSSMVRECIAGEPLVILSDRFLIYDGTGLTPAELDCLDRLPGKR